MPFIILLGLDLVAAAVVVYFFLVGLADGSVSDFNMGTWTAVLLAVACIIAGGVALRRVGRTILANVVLLVLALPVALYGLFMLLVIVSGERWN